jgi:hypothetical protein
MRLLGEAVASLVRPVQLIRPTQGQQARQIVFLVDSYSFRSAHFAVALADT